MCRRASIQSMCRVRPCQLGNDLRTKRTRGADSSKHLLVDSPPAHWGRATQRDPTTTGLQGVRTYTRTWRVGEPTYTRTWRVPQYEVVKLYNCQHFRALK